MIKQLSTKLVYENKFMKIHEDQVEFANGYRGMYGYMDKTDYSLIIPYEDDHFYLVNQYRYPIKKESLEFPAGRTEGKKLSGEEMAMNELQEETGLVAKKMEKIGFLYSAPASITCGAHIFLATDFKQVERKLDATESDLTIRKVSVHDFERFISDGTICEFPTVAAYALLKIKKPAMV